MVTTFNSKDMVSFGKYLLSEKRESRLRQSDIENPKGLPYEERFRDVHHADLANWKSEKDEFKNITDVEQMCLESLNPSDFKHWEIVKEILMNTRGSLIRS